MIVRALALAGGLTFGAGLSQFPEFSQQYAQRLGGAVDALGVVVADFDASAAAEGLSRDAALSQMQGTGFIERRRNDMERTFARHEKLTADMAALKGQGPFTRAWNAARMTDGDVMQATWRAYQPAVPLTLTGGAFAAAGFLLGLVFVGALMALIRLPFRFRRRRRA